MNYGGIGAVIGHEIGHGFDDQGSKWDGAGNLNQWWTPADRAEFDKRGDALAAQFDQFEPFPGFKVNGRLTLGENIADLAGLTIAYEAYQLSLGGKPAPVIDGLTGDQRFFLGWAQVWRRKHRDADLEEPPGHRSPLSCRVPRQRHRPQRAGVLCGVRRQAGRQDVSSPGETGEGLVIGIAAINKPRLESG